MELARQIALIACVAASTAQIACVASTELGDEEAVEEAQQEVLVHNALTRNALTRNALTRNALTRNALTRNALTRNALMGNSFTSEALRDPESRELLSFIVSCALPEDEHIVVDVGRASYQFDGELGLAPEWGRRRGSCDESCQEWVSACLLARVNHRGEHVTISLRGRNEALKATSNEREEYGEAEAAYYGNVFLPEQRRYACLAPGQTSIPRVCGDSLDDCVVDVVGECEDVCDRPRRDGSFPDCRDRNPFELACGLRVFPPRTDLYKSSITVFLE
ncbi:membrane protein [Sorangium cellulosum]|uniref:Membrane protein n=1 Tax=Sorangium cellulosum TaxID=56 RepID=A0A2L0FAP4_SORCE|nr:hypothetical protein [Sorangium cellulosum]AUX48650.1 membrane protein [Sorangium cellulosum]